MTQGIILLLKENLAKIAPEFNTIHVENHDCLVDIGLSSVQIGKLLMLTLNNLEVNFDEAKIVFAEAQTLEELAEAIQDF